MTDDLGRGMLNWSAERWQALDALAEETVGEHVVFRPLVDHREDAGCRSARIAGRNVDVKNLEFEFAYDMEEENEEDLHRKVRLAGQELARLEDEEILRAIKPMPVVASEWGYQAFSQGKSELNRRSVRAGLGVVVSPEVLSSLEIQVAGNQTGLEVARKLLATQFAQSNALSADGPGAIILQAVPPAYRMVRAWGARLRVLACGAVVRLRLEEGIAVGELEPNRCIGLAVGAEAGYREAPPAAVGIGASKPGNPRT